MVKVQLPKVKQENRIELNVLKAQRDDTTLDNTLEYLLKLPRLSIATIERLNKKRQWIIDRQETDDELVNRFLDYMEETPTAIIGRAIRNAMESTIEEIDTWNEFSPEFREWLKRFPVMEGEDRTVQFFPKPDPSKIKPSKNLCCGSPEKFEACLKEVIEDNKEGLIRLGRS